jgi:transcriptional regulator with XRE-family HTH domain
MKTGLAENRPYTVRAMAGRRPSRGKSVFGRRLAAVREERGLTQTALAARLGVNQSTVAYYETQSPSPSVDFAKQCADILDVTIEDLVSDEPAKRSKRGPPSKFEEKIEQLRKLPKREQDTVLKMLEGLLGS